MKFQCPVCMFDSMPYPPSDYNICPCCSTEFGNDDSAYSHRQLREIWVASGAHWFFGAPPKHWNPWTQLLRAGLGAYLPKEFRVVLVQSYATAEYTLTENFMHSYYSDQNPPRFPVAA